ncbi:hypothetical protein Tco_0955515 [Tanacetum coccineum]|uniref:Uncharacterized protein n=1 Tax=Tanacetum coccineum TaxID=301880 RepID=A0ABQ5E7E7_9ASTR
MDDEGMSKKDVLGKCQQCENQEPIVEALQKEPRCLKALEDAIASKYKIEEVKEVIWSLRIPTPFVNTRKKRVREVVKEYFYHNGDVYKTLDLDDDDLEMMEDYLDLNPNEWFVDTEEEEI